MWSSTLRSSRALEFCGLVDKLAEPQPQCAGVISTSKRRFSFGSSRGRRTIRHRGGNICCGASAADAETPEAFSCCCDCGHLSASGSAANDNTIVGGTADGDAAETNAADGNTPY